MKMNIILECDSFKLEKLKHWLKTSKAFNYYKIYILTQNSRHYEFKKELGFSENIICITYDDMLNYKSKSNLEPSRYSSFISSLLNDHITSRMLDRDAFWPKEYGIGVNNAFSYYTFSSYGLLGFLLEKEIQIIYFRNTPHEAIEWVLAKASEFLNIDIYTSERYVLPWLYSISKGYKKDRQTLLNDKTFNDKEQLKYHIRKFIGKIQGDYSKAIPSYEKDRLSKGIFRFYNPFKQKRYSIKRLDNFINKTKIFFYYKKHSKHIDLKTIDYAVFFLQYQPERSTLPEGFEFADQFYTINLISRMLPKGSKLLVKEHPSMFTRVCDVKARNIYHFKQLNKLENVVLCPLEIDSFKLIDNAKVVLNITGTVALESYVRKTPVILFGRSLLRLKGVHVYQNFKALQNFINDAFNDKIKIENIVDELTDLCSENNISGLDLSIKEDIDYYNFYRFEDQAHFKLLTKTLLNKFKSV